MNSIRPPLPPETPPGVRLLGALRVWRVARVMNTLLLSADEAHDQTRDTLRLAEKVKGEKYLGKTPRNGMLPWSRATMPYSIGKYISRDEGLPRR